MSGIQEIFEYYILEAQELYTKSTDNYHHKSLLPAPKVSSGVLCPSPNFSSKTGTILEKSQVFSVEPDLGFVLNGINWHRVLCVPTGHQYECPSSWNVLWYCLIVAREKGIVSWRIMNIHSSLHPKPLQGNRWGRYTWKPEASGQGLTFIVELVV